MRGYTVSVHCTDWNYYRIYTTAGSDPYDAIDRVRQWVYKDIGPSKAGRGLAFGCDLKVYPGVHK
jgi:hypothetical protein